MPYRWFRSPQRKTTLHIRGSALLSEGTTYAIRSPLSPAEPHHTPSKPVSRSQQEPRRIIRSSALLSENHAHTYPSVPLCQQEPHTYQWFTSLSEPHTYP
ncbi:hypothetical protein AVEN_73400-1 [Araneus ventricosus]|uniref:Uncharacterized protein n=1 Tax=Araneus ventricosus TaxID=182803 RepID=A0A4Y2W8T2_ARAVE|nr:hypothetical protein AVEN_73400-1 [Araneus ventricosus]